MEITPSALKHGISPQRIWEVLDQTVTAVPGTRGFSMHLGHDANGVPIEVGVRDGVRIVHAMRMRPRWLAIYRRYL